MFRRSAVEMRVLVLAPIGRDAELLANTLALLQIETAVADNAAALLRMLGEGAGAAIVAEEALRSELVHDLVSWLGSQPPWSDMPFIVLTSSGRPTRENHRRAEEIQALGNITLIERPVRPETVQSSARAALRARMRQYEVRSRQEALLQANADLEQFAHSASHDLREPLRSIGIYSDLLSKKYGPLLDEKGLDFLASIQSGAKRMDALLTDLLSYAHASGISDDGVEPVDAKRPLEAAIQGLAGAIQESGAQISAEEMPVVKMRESHLSQIFQNLIGNAIKYRKESDRLEIQVLARQSSEGWIFCISDNGIGVAGTYKESIFGLFNRLHTNAKYPGTGMGLAICKRIVERYRGRIWVESEVEHGSKFYFLIPS